MHMIILVKEGKGFTLLARRRRAKEYRKESNYVLFRLATAFSLQNKAKNMISCWSKVLQN